MLATDTHTKCVCGSAHRGIIKRALEAPLQGKDNGNKVTEKPERESLVHTILRPIMLFTEVMILDTLCINTALKPSCQAVMIPHNC